MTLTMPIRDMLLSLLRPYIRAGKAYSITDVSIKSADVCTKSCSASKQAKPL